MEIENEIGSLMEILDIDRLDKETSKRLQRKIDKMHEKSELLKRSISSTNAKTDIKKYD